MKQIITFFEMRSSLRVSLIFLLLSTISISTMNAQAPQFTQTYIFQSPITSPFASAWGSDVVFGNGCNPVPYFYGTQDNVGMGGTQLESNIVVSYPSGSPLAYSNYVYDQIYNMWGNGDYQGISGINDSGFPTGGVNDIALSPNWEKYICGVFINTISFETGLTLNAAGTNGYLSNNQFNTPWAITLPNMTPLKMIALSNATFIVIGNFTGTVTLNGHTISTSTGGNMFCAKFLSNGTCIALTHINAGSSIPKAVRLTDNGHFYVVGTHSNGAMIAGNLLNGTGAFAALYDTSLYAISAIHIGIDGYTYSDMDVDADGNSYLLHNVSVHKYNFTNQIVWSTGVYAGTSLDGNGDGGIYGFGVDKYGNIGIAGSYFAHSGLIINGNVIAQAESFATDDIYRGFYALAASPLKIVAPNPICAGGASTLTLYPGAGTSNYTWQQSTNGGASWYSVSGTNPTTTSTVATLTLTRLFRVIYSSTCGIDTTPVFTLNVVPDPTVTLSASNNNFCAGENTTLTATLNGGVGTGIYQWQQYIGANWTNIPGATSATYTTPTLSANTNYKVISSQTGLGCVTTGANTINVFVKPLPTVYTNPDSAHIVNGNSITLHAYNAASYDWSPATGLNTTTGATVIANPSTTTTYAITGIGANGCSKTIYLPITVSYSTSTEENIINHFSIFPNPADKNIKISMNTDFSQTISFVISDVLGKMLTQWEGKPENGLYEHEISIEDLPQGIYFLSVKIGDSVMSQKFVKE